MRVFHHKTRHWYFKFGIPAILLAQIALGVFVYVRFFAAINFWEILFFVKQNRRFLRLINEAKGNRAKREDKEFMNFPFSCSLISRGMVKYHV